MVNDSTSLDVAMNRIRNFLTLASVLLVAGCYHYVPAEPSTLARGAQIRAQVADSAAQRVRPYLNTRGGYLEGQLLRWDDVEGAELLVGPFGNGMSSYPGAIRDTVHVLPRDLAGMEIRELSRGRTAGLVGVMVGGAVASILIPQALSSGSAPEGDNEGEPGGDPEAQIRIPIPLFFWVR
jgi:hypothetical protein